MTTFLMISNLLDASVADVDAIVMLENIKALNYTNIDRCVGFDSDETRAIIRVFIKNAFYAILFWVRFK